MRRLVESERGTMLILVGLSAFVLMGMSAFVLDYGVLWLTRRQAQNAADAGALAGAVARAYDETANPPSANGPAFQSASKAALANPVLGAGATATVSWNCPSFVGGGTNCVQVDVFRDGSNGSTALPTWFAPLFGVNTQGIRATATAWATTGNTTNCVRPFSVTDKWIEQVPVGPPRPPALTDDYDHWVKVGNSAVALNPADSYTPPSANSPGTGFQLPADYGTRVTLKTGNNPQSPSGGISPGWSLPVRLPDGAGGWFSGANDYSGAIASCTAGPVTVGQYLPAENGVMNGPTIQGTNALIALDKGASWNGSTIVGSCAPGCAPMSPRIVPISVFDVDEWQYRSESGDWNDAQGNNVCPIANTGCVKVVNILGFFVENQVSGDITGILLTHPGALVQGPPAPGGGAGFLQVIQLIR